MSGEKQGSDNMSPLSVRDTDSLEGYTSPEPELTPQLASQTVKFGKDLVKKVFALSTKHGFLNPLRGAKKYIKLLESLFYDEIPEFLKNAILEKLTHRGITLRDGELDATAYTLIISTIEKTCNGKYRMALTRENHTMEKWMDTFVEYDSALPHKPEDIRKAALIFVLMTRVSYQDIALNRHPYTQHLDWVDLSRHYNRDFILLNGGLFQKQSDLCKLGGLFQKESDLCKLALSIYIQLMNHDYSPLKVCIRTASIDRLVQHGACRECCIDCNESNGRVLKSPSKIFEKCETGFFHEPFGSECSYVCNKCKTPGHHIRDCARS